MTDLFTKQKQFFEQLKDKRITASVIDNAARATGYAPEMVPLYLACAEGYGINIEKELAELAAAGEKAKTEKNDQKRRADIKTTAGKIQDHLTSLDAIIESAPLDEISASAASLSAEAAGLITTAAKINRFPTWADYENTWQKESDHDFSPELFSRLSFPECTVSYIGARTGRGKTTAMINICVEALFQYTKPRRALFISLEETQKQILRRLSLCLAYRNANKIDREILLAVENPYTGKTDPKNAYKNWKRKRELVDNACFVKHITTADERIKREIQNGNFIFFDGIGASMAEILSAIKTIKRGDIVLLDYIQKIPASKESRSGNPDLERIREGSEKLIEAAKLQECVVIAGAQFNREGYKQGKNKDDEFTDADFRGCGDLEQDGHNLIGIGRNEDKTQTYYKIIKSREGEITDKNIILNFAGGYSFMENTKQEFIKSKKKENPGQKNVPKKEATGELL